MAKSWRNTIRAKSEVRSHSGDLIMDWRSPRHKPWIRFVCLFIITAFLNQDIAFAQGGNPTWFKGEKAAPHDINILGYNYKKPALNNDTNVSIPQNIAVTKESYDSGNGDIIFNIQDAHASLGAQESIAKVLDTLVSQYDLSLIAIEGSENGYINTNLLKSFPHADIKEKVAHDLMAEGRISAGAFFSVTSTEDVAVYGIEDKDLYEENVEQFRALYEMRTSMLPSLEALKGELDAFSNVIYSESIKELLKNSVMNDEDNELTFEKRWKYLSCLAEKKNISLNAFANLKKLNETLAIEATIDFSNANAERDSIIDTLSGSLEKEALEALVMTSLSFKTGTISQGAFYRYLARTAEEAGIDLTQRKDFTGYTAYITKYESIDLVGVFEESKHFEQKIIGHLFENDLQKKLFQYSKLVELLTKLFDVKLTNGDIYTLTRLLDEMRSEANTSKARLLRFARNDEKEARNDKPTSLREAQRRSNLAENDKVASNLASFIKELSQKTDLAILGGYDLTAIFKNTPKALEFYRTAEDRNEKILKNTIRAMKENNQHVAALITGGYHTKGITDLLKKENTSYMVILPKFDKDSKERPYVAILTNKKASKERLLETGEYYLATIDLLSGGTREDYLKIATDALQLAKDSGKNLDDTITEWVKVFRVMEGKLKGEEKELRVRIDNRSEKRAPFSATDLEEHLEKIRDAITDKDPVRRSIDQEILLRGELSENGLNEKDLAIVLEVVNRRLAEEDNDLDKVCGVLGIRGTLQEQVNAKILEQEAGRSELVFAESIAGSIDDVKGAVRASPSGDDQQFIRDAAHAHDSEPRQSPSATVQKLRDQQHRRLCTAIIALDPEDAKVRYGWSGEGNDVMLRVDKNKGGIAENWVDPTEPKGDDKAVFARIPNTAVTGSDGTLPDITFKEQLEKHPEMLGQGLGLTQKRTFAKILSTRFAPFVYMGFKKKIEAQGGVEAFKAALKADRGIMAEIKDNMRDDLSAEEFYQLFEEVFKPQYEAWVNKESAHDWTGVALLPDFSDIMKSGYALEARLRRLCQIRDEIASYLHKIELKDGMVILSPVGFPHGIFGLSLQTHPMPAENANAKNEAWIVKEVTGADGRKHIVLIEPQQMSDVTISFWDSATPLKVEDGAPAMRKDMTKKLESITDTEPADENAAIDIIVDRALLKVGFDKPNDFIIRNADRSIDKTTPIARDGAVRARETILIQGTHDRVWPLDLLRTHVIKLEGTVETTAIMPLPDDGIYSDILVTEGTVTIRAPGEEPVTLGPGGSAFISALTKNVKIEASCDAEVYKIFPGEHLVNTPPAGAVDEADTVVDIAQPSKEDLRRSPASGDEEGEGTEREISEDKNRATEAVKNLFNDDERIRLEAHDIVRDLVIDGDAAILKVLTSSHHVKGNNRTAVSMMMMNLGLDDRILRARARDCLLFFAGSTDPNLAAQIAQQVPKLVLYLVQEKDNPDVARDAKSLLVSFAVINNRKITKALAQESEVIIKSFVDDLTDDIQLYRDGARRAIVTFARTDHPRFIRAIIGNLETIVIDGVNYTNNSYDNAIIDSIHTNARAISNDLGQLKNETLAHALDTVKFLGWDIIRRHESRAALLDWLEALIMSPVTLFFKYYSRWHEPQDRRAWIQRVVGIAILNVATYAGLIYAIYNIWANWHDIGFWGTLIRFFGIPLGANTVIHGLWNTVLVPLAGSFGYQLARLSTMDNDEEYPDRDNGRGPDRPNIPWGEGPRRTPPRRSPSHEEPVDPQIERQSPSAGSPVEFNIPMFERCIQKASERASEHLEGAMEASLIGKERFLQSEIAFDISVALIVPDRTIALYDGVSLFMRALNEELGAAAVHSGISVTARRLNNRYQEDHRMTIEISVMDAMGEELKLIQVHPFRSWEECVCRMLQNFMHRITPRALSPAFRESGRSNIEWYLELEYYLGDAGVYESVLEEYKASIHPDMSLIDLERAQTLERKVRRKFDAIYAKKPWEKRFPRIASFVRGVIRGRPEIVDDLAKKVKSPVLPRGVAVDEEYDLPVYFGSEGDTELISDEELRILDESSDDSDPDGEVSRQSPTSSEDVATGKDGSIVRKSPEPRIVSFDEIASATTQLPEGQESMGDALTIKIAEVLARASEEEMCEGDIIHAQEIMAESDTIFFAVIGGEIVGFVSLKRDETNSLCIMGDLNVDAACQGQGIGSALFDQALRYAHENGLGELAFSLETDVVPFYKRNISRYRKHLRKTGRIGMFEPICRVLEFKESYDVDFTYFVKVPQGGRLPVAAARNGPAENVAYDLRAGLSRPSNSGCVVIDQGSHTKLHMNGLSKNTGTVAEQFEDILRYTQGMLAHHDAGMSNVVLGNIYLASMADRAECEAILRRHCGDASPPPVNFLEQPPMEPGHVVSFEAWAVIPHSDDVMIHRITDNTTVVEENGVYTVHIGGIVADKDFQDKFHEQMFDHEVTVVHEGGEFTTSIPQKEDPNAYYDESYVALLNLQFELDKVNKALKTNFSYEDLVRAWFYNPGFLSPDSHPSGQRYKTFCAARTDFYEPVVGKAYSGIDIRRPIKFLRRILDKNFLRKNPDFGNDGTSAGKRYPASTGIGVPMSRPLTLGAIAVSTVRGREGRVSAAPIKNAGQINPADYADEYGKKSPKFSRATFFRIAENLASLFVSGTASIIGEESVYIGDIEKQTEQTLDNIKNLISERNMRFLGLAGWGAKPRDVAFLTVYIKKPHAAHEEEARRILRENYETARRVCEREFPGIPITYVEADVCRDDLLVEIEGVAYVRYSPSLLDRVIGFLRDLAERLVKWLTGAKGRLSPEEAEDRAVSFYRAVDRLTKEILTRDSDSAVLDPIDVEREERGTFIFRDWFADVIGYVYSIGMSSGYWTVEDARNELTTVNMILDDILDRPDNRYTEPSPAVVEAAGQTFRCELLIEGAVESSRRDRRQFLPEHRVQIAEIRNRIDEILDLLDGIDGDKTLNDLIKDRIETSTNRPPVNELYPTQQRVEEAERRSRMVREIRAQFGEGANGTLGEDGSHPRQSPSSSDDADARAGKDAPAEGPHAGRGAFSGMTSDDYIKLDKAIRVIKEISTEHDQAYSRWKDNWQNEPEPELSDEEIQLLRGHVRIVESYIRDADHQKSDAAIRMIRDLLRAVALYPEYDRQMLGDTMRRVVRRQARRGEYVLDIGSGGGYQTFNALEAGAQFAVCVDIKAEALLATLARAAEIGVLDKIAVDLVDARRMSEWTPPHTFDRIISMNPVSILLDHDDPIGNWGLFDNNYFDIDGRMQDGILDAVGSLLKKDGVVNYLATFGALYGIRRRGYEIFDEEPDDRGKMISVITFRRKKDDQGRTAPRQSPTGGKDHRKRLKKKGYHRAERRYRNKKERHHKESKEYGEAVRLRKRDGTADHRRAIKILSKKVNSYGPEQKIRAINMIGDSMQRIGDYEGVIRLLEPVIAGERERAEPNDFMFTTLAKAYVASGRAPEAIVLLRPIVDGRTPIVATGYLFSTLGRAYLHLPDPDPDAAIALLRPLAERRSVIKPVRNVYHQLSEAYLLKGDRRMAAAVLESVIEGRRSDPPNDRTYGLLANVYTESGRALDAVVLLEQVMAHKTKVEPSTFIVNMLGNAYIHSGRPVDAIRLLGPVTEGKDRNIEPNVHTYNNLAKAHIANGQYWKVIAVLQTLILEEGDVLPNTLSYKFLGKAYLKMRRPNDTIRLLEPVVQLETVRGENVRPDAAMCDIIATAYLRKGWLDDAEQACLIGADLRPADIMIRYLLKKIYRVKGDKGKAGEVEREIEALEAQEVERGGSADADAIDLRGSGTDQGPDDGHFRESPSSGEALEPEEKPEQAVEQNADDREAVKKPMFVKGAAYALPYLLFTGIGIIASKIVFNTYIPADADFETRMTVASQFIFSLAVFSNVWLMVASAARGLIDRIRPTAEKAKSAWDLLFPELELIKSLDREDRGLLVYGSSISHFIGSLAFHFGLSILTSALSVFVYEIILPLTFIMGRIKLQEKITLEKVLGGLMVSGTVLAVAGFLKDPVTAQGAGISTALQTVGIGAVVMSALAFAYRRIATKSFFVRHPQVRLPALKFSYGVTALGLAIPVFLLYALGVSGFPLLLSPWLIFGAAVFLPLSHITMFTAQSSKDFSVMHMAPIISAVPIAVMFLEGLMLGVWPAHLGWMIAAGVAVMFSVGIATRERAVGKEAVSEERVQAAEANGLSESTQTPANRQEADDRQPRRSPSSGEPEQVAVEVTRRVGESIQLTNYFTLTVDKVENATTRFLLSVAPSMREMVTLQVLPDRQGEKRLLDHEKPVLRVGESIHFGRTFRVEVAGYAQASEVALDVRAPFNIIEEIIRSGVNDTPELRGLLNLGFDNVSIELESGKIVVVFQPSREISQLTKDQVGPLLTRLPKSEKEPRHRVRETGVASKKLKEALDVSGLPVHEIRVVTDPETYYAAESASRRSPSGEEPRFMIQAHRGRTRLNVPENSVEAFREAAIDDRIDIIEFDIELTSDDTFVVIQSAGKQIPALGGRRIREVTAANAEAAGIPTLVEALPILTASDKILKFDVKDFGRDGQEDRILQRLVPIFSDDTLRARSIFRSFNNVLAIKVREVFPDLEIEYFGDGAPISEATAGADIAKARDLGCRIISVPLANCTDALIARLRSERFEVDVFDFGFEELDRVRLLLEQGALIVSSGDAKINDALVEAYPIRAGPEGRQTVSGALEARHSPTSNVSDGTMLFGIPEAGRTVDEIDALKARIAYISDGMITLAPVAGSTEQERLEALRKLAEGNDPRIVRMLEFDKDADALEAAVKELYNELNKNTIDELREALEIIKRTLPKLDKVDFDRIIQLLRENTLRHDISFTYIQQANTAAWIQKQNRVVSASSLNVIENGLDWATRIKTRIDNMKPGDIDTVDEYIVVSSEKERIRAENYLEKTGLKEYIPKENIIMATSAQAALEQLGEGINARNVGIRVLDNEKFTQDNDDVVVLAIRPYEDGRHYNVNSYEVLFDILANRDKTEFTIKGLEYDPVERIYRYLPPAVPVDYRSEVQRYRNTIELILAAA